LAISTLPTRCAFAPDLPTIRLCDRKCKGPSAGADRPWASVRSAATWGLLPLQKGRPRCRFHAAARDWLPAFRP